MLKNIVVVLLLAVLVSSCSLRQAEETSSSDQAVVEAINANSSIFSLGSSGDANNGTLGAYTTSPEARALIWYRIFQLPSDLDVSVLSNDASTAVVGVNMTGDGTLYMKMGLFTSMETKSFSHEYDRYVELTSANGGISWSISRWSPAVSKSTDNTPASGIGSIASDLTISRMVITAISTSGTTTLYDVSAEASAAGPWFDFTLPKISRGDTLEVTVYASRTGDTATPFVYVWPIYKNCFRRPLFDDGTHGDTVSGDGTFVNTTQPFTVPSNEVIGVRHLHVGVFSSGALADTTTPYNFSSWHFLYEIE